MAVFPDGAVHLQQDGGQHQYHGGHAQHHALGHDDAQVHAQGQPHEAQGQKARDGGQGAAGQGLEGGHDGGGHGVPLVRVAGDLLHIAVVEEDGVVHGDAQLQHRRDGLGDKRDLTLEEVGAEVIDHGQADAAHQGHRQRPRLHHHAHGDHGQGHGHQYVQRHLLGNQVLGVFDKDGEAGQKAVFVAQGADLFDGFHRGLRGAGLVVLDDHHGGVAGEEDVSDVRGKHLLGDLDAH